MTKNILRVFPFAVGAMIATPASAFEFGKPCNLLPPICGSKTIHSRVVTAPQTFPGSNSFAWGKTTNVEDIDAQLRGPDGRIYNVRIVADNPYTRKCAAPLSPTAKTYTINVVATVTGAAVHGTCKDTTVASNKQQSSSNQTKSTTKASNKGSQGSGSGAVANHPTGSGEKTNTNSGTSQKPTTQAAVTGDTTGSGDRQVQEDKKDKTGMSDLQRKIAMSEEAHLKKEGVSSVDLNGEQLGDLKLGDGAKGVLKRDENGRHYVTITNPGKGGGAEKGQRYYTDNGEQVGDKFVTGSGTKYTNRADWMAADGNKNGKITYEDGSTVTYKDGVAVEATDKNGKKKTREELAAHKSGGNSKDKDDRDECEASAQIGKEKGKNYRCSPTYGIAKATETANQVLTGAGRSMVNQIGNGQIRRMQNGRISGAQDAAAKMAKTSFTYETGLGVANVAAAAILAKKTKQHGNNIVELRAGMQDAELNAEMDVNDVAAAKKAKRYQTAVIEQKQAKQKAKDATFVATMAGVQALAGAVTAKKMQKQAEENARLDRANQKLIEENTFAYDNNPLFNMTPGGAYDPNQQAATDGTETQSAGQTDTLGGPGADTPFAGLGKGNDLTGVNDGGPVGPKAGAFKAGAGAPGGGGAGAGGGGAGAGGGGGGGPENAEENKAAYASEFATKERYETGGAAGGRGGAKGGAEKDEGGIDLNGLLAQFLPKDEKDIGPQNGILDFAGNRGIAAEEPEASYLDKNADLFQRIHETMTEKNRKGHVGI